MPNVDSFTVVLTTTIASGLLVKRKIGFSCCSSVDIHHMNLHYWDCAYAHNLQGIRHYKIALNDAIRIVQTITQSLIIVSPQSSVGEYLRRCHVLARIQREPWPAGASVYGRISHMLGLRRQPQLWPAFCQDISSGGPGLFRDGRARDCYMGGFLFTGTQDPDCGEEFWNVREHWTQQLPFFYCCDL